MAENSDTFVPKYATFNIRLLAATIDIGVIMILVTPIIEFISAHLFPLVNTPDMRGMLTMTDSEALLMFQNFIKTQPVLERFALSNLLQLFFIALYVLPFWFKYSSTPGKMLFRVSICDATSGERMTRRQIVIRFLGYIVSGIPLTLGFAWALCNKKHQGVHDLMAHTVVVVKPRERSLIRGLYEWIKSSVLKR